METESKYQHKGGSVLMGEDQNLRRCILEMNGDEQELVALRIDS